MRRIALFALPLLLPGCAGYGAFLGDTFSADPNPHAPKSGSETMQRAMGDPAEAPPLLPESGNIWPGPPPAEPTLLNVMDNNQPLGATQPNTGPGSSTPPGSVQPGLPALARPGVPTSRAPAKRPPSDIVQTPDGTAVTTGNGDAYKTITNPNGGAGGIIVPNGNGTSTIIMPDGTIKTVPSTK